MDALKIVLICIMWYMCSSCDNIIGKVILNEFQYPMTITMAYLVTLSVGLEPFLRYMKVPTELNIPKRYYFTMIIPLALGKFLSSLSSFISIWKSSVSYAHTVKATLPLFTVVLSRVILKEKQTWPVYISILPIIGGVIIATVTESKFEILGLYSALFATTCFSLQVIFSKKCLKETGLHHLRLLVLCSRIAAMLFIPFWLLWDFRKIIHDEEFMESGKIMQTLFLILCDSVFNALHNVFAFTLLSMVMPLSYAVANATKRIVIISSSLIILQNPVTSMNIVGMLVAIFGVLCYNKVCSFFYRNLSCGNYVFIFKAQHLY
ncbi:hypothetical protein LOTGIDRAFT_102951 [Lottia gigantea]|uniref:Sugar phosphate transporter domain-containing protein n=1 Tax=Lottia gigantea TaxID=225164 RepID=V4BGX3_LOTGI|nr:hypothetical protein LOTGIDRAFT_102951 [Lottia gigantea]ESP05172.1 hypothetical protein LOTGIDRAFT_102951 [Lottia gigantea]